MIVSKNMVAETEAELMQNVPMLEHMQYHKRVASQEHNLPIELSSSPSSPIVHEVLLSESSRSTELPSLESVVSCPKTIKDAVPGSSVVKFVPNIRSGSYTDIGRRDSMEDEHIQIDDLSAHLGSLFKCPMPSAFYAVFDGHRGPDAAAYIKRNAMRLFFEDANLPPTPTIDADDVFLDGLENSHRKAFLLADHALAEEKTVRSSCGTTALTAMLLGRHLLVANAGDCRAVLCRKGVAVEMSNDHRLTYLPELRRVEELGGCIHDGYLNGLSVTRALGDWDMKFPLGSSSALIAEPDVQQEVLTEDDEFLIIGCDGIWDVMSSQYAVSLVRRGLRRHDDPQQCAKELVMEALRLNAYDNLTVIVICFAFPSRVFESHAPRRQKFRTCSLSEDARSRLRSLLEGN